MPTRLFASALLVVLVPFVSRAEEPPLSSPPLIQSAPSATNPAAASQSAPAPPSAPDAAATPPPPGATPPPPGTQVDPSAGMVFSPFGTPQPLVEPPRLELGLMFAELAFGALTAAGTALIPYYLLLKPLSSQVGTDPTVTNLLTVLVFGAVPLAVAQTQVGLANGSRYFISETWPASLGCLGAQAAVLGVYYLTRSPFQPGNETLLIVGTVAFAPLVGVAVIHLTKSPRFGPAPRIAGLFTRDEAGEVALGVPAIAPVLSQRGSQTALGAQLLLAAGRL